MSDPLLDSNSAIRLLREQWQTPTDLAQELYAMLTATGPREIRDTLTIRVPEGTPALRVIHEKPAATEPTVIHQYATPKVLADASPPAQRVRRNRPEDDDPKRVRRGFTDEDRARRREEQAFSTPDAKGQALPFPAIEFDTPARFSQPVVFDQVIFRQPPLVFDPTTGRLMTWEEIMQDRPSHARNVLGGDATPPAKAVVIEGSGDTYTVQVYATVDADQPLKTNGVPTRFTLKVPSIDASETIPAGTVLYPCFKEHGLYVHQPAVWMP